MSGIAAQSLAAMARHASIALPPASSAATPAKADAGWPATTALSSPRAARPEP
ncbi:MAG: hypothetical protein ACKO1J_17550 [Tagaea sp.]